MIPKSGYRFSEKIMLHQKCMIQKKPAPGPTGGPAPDVIWGGYRFSEKACPRECGRHAPPIM